MLINCDLGEWETLEETEWMMQRIELANVACGGHAGSPEQLVASRAFADKFEVELGMHPGVSADKGRGDVSDLSTRDFLSLLGDQRKTFERYAGKPTHLKLHGSLYHLSEQNEAIRMVLMDFVGELALPLVSLANGLVWRECIASDHPCHAEAFLDRHYLPDGSLVPRTHADALIHSVEEARDRFFALKAGKPLLTVDGTPLSMRVDTVCVHSDSVMVKKLLA